MTSVSVDVVIACHDESRPIERAVRSVLQDPVAHSTVQVTIVAHGIDPQRLQPRLESIPGRIRVVPFADGVRSAAGPFNHGLSIVEGEYCAVMGSDDFLEPGAMEAWIAHVESHRPDIAIAPIRIDGQTVMPNPLVRLGRRRRLDAARDRLFYRTAPLGLIRTATMRDMQLRMTEGVRVGEDVGFSVPLFSLSERVDFVRGAPCYVIGTDARERTTLAPMSAEEALDAVVRLLESGLLTTLHPSHRRALAIKLVRVSVLGLIRSRVGSAAWRDDDEVAFVASVLRRILALAPAILTPFNRQDRRLIDGLLEDPRAGRVTADVIRAVGAGRMQRWFTRNPLHSFDREATLRRYVLYFLTRDRRSRER